MRIVVERDMEQPGDRVWATLSDVEHIDTWLPDIAQSSATGFAVGETRDCRLAKKRLGVSEIHEVFTDVGDRSLGYTVSGFPFQWHNQWEVIGDDAPTVRIETTMDLPWYLVPIAPVLKGMMKSQNRGMLKALDEGAAKRA